MSEHDETRPITTDGREQTSTTEVVEPTEVIDPAEQIEQTEETEETSSDEATEQDASGTHPVNVAHLVMGLAFVLLVGVWALVAGDVVEGRDVRWLLPLPFLGAGAAGLVATTVRGRSRMAR